MLTPRDGPNGYPIKVQETDPFGRIVSWARDVTVIPASRQQSLNIYNSAGERVRSLDVSSLGSGARIANFAIADSSNKAFVVPPDPNPLGGLKLTMTDVHGVQTQMPWDGRNSQGQAVASGIYNIQLFSKTDTGAIVIASRDIVVLKNPDSQVAVDARIVVNIGPWSTGIYLGAFEVREGSASVSRRPLRLALRR